jgi:hypothetical protein
MAKKRWLTETVKNTIYSYAVEMYPKMPAQALAEKLQDVFLNMDSLGRHVPEQVTIVDYIREYRRKDAANRLSAPWSLATLADPSIPPMQPEALPAVMQIFKKRLCQKRLYEEGALPIVSKVSGERSPEKHEDSAAGIELTIREALWISRLYTLFKGEDLADQLEGWAWWYARRQQAYEVMEKPFDTSTLDALLAGMPSEESGKTTVVATVNGRRVDLSQYETTTKKSKKEGKRNEGKVK